jgi:hypothetical protein
MIVATIHAGTADELHDIGSAAQNAEFDWHDARFDRAGGVVTVPFAQEALPGLPQPAPGLVGRGRWRARIYKVPYMRCWFTVRRATRLLIQTTGRDEPGMLADLEYDEDEGVIRVRAAVGPELRLVVDAVDVDLVATDEVTFHVRRARSRLGGRSDRRWRDGDD